VDPKGGAMKAYVIASGGIFVVLTIAHLMRIAMEDRPARQ